MKEGNGAPDLCLFGEDVTPNHHALAREFVLLDNFYCDAEVSADGHEWSMGAYATDYVERTWPSNYGGHGALRFPAEGRDPNGNSSTGYLWDRAREAGITYRSYGEWVTGGARDEARSLAPALVGHICPDYPQFDMTVLDEDKAATFTKELKEFEAKGELPRLMIVRLPNDHTAGTRKGWRTPTAYVAEHDQGLGTIIEALSQSKFWPEMAVFMVEDDAQNGSDHVDAHRTVALVAGPHVKRGYVDHTLYSTTSMLRTMELILGLEPMSQFDAAARPMFNCFTATPDTAPYKKKPARVSLTEKNGDKAPMVKESAKLDLTHEDANPDVAFNEIIWKSVKGADSAMPPPVRAAYIKPIKDDDDDD